MQYFSSVLLFLCVLAGIFPLYSASIAEKTPYPTFCQQAAEDDAVFANFKRHPSYCQILEHVTYEHGKQYLEIICEEYPWLLAYIERFRENDALGNPITYEYEGIGQFSPTTLRYMKVAGDLHRVFGDLSRLNIVEIGGGYGGQCKILASCGGFASYTIVDLPPSCALTEKYLKLQQVDHVTCLDNEHLPDGSQYDLVISNFAFSEIDCEEQYRYLERVIKPIPNGYMTYNFISGLFQLQSITLEELLHFLADHGHVATVEREKPVNPSSNCLLIWQGPVLPLQRKQ